VLRPSNTYAHIRLRLAQQGMCCALEIWLFTSRREARPFPIFLSATFGIPVAKANFQRILCCLGLLRRTVSQITADYRNLPSAIAFANCIHRDILQSSASAVVSIAAEFKLRKAYPPTQSDSTFESNYRLYIYRLDKPAVGQEKNENRTTPNFTRSGFLESSTFH